MTGFFCDLSGLEIMGLDVKSLVRQFGSFCRSFRFSGSGGSGLDWGSWLVPGSSYDYRQEAGVLWGNSIVLACLYWMVRTFPEAPVRVKRLAGSGRYEICETHPVVSLINLPNRFYDGSVLWAGTLLSLNTDGNAYWYKVRSAAGKVVELWYVPHFQIELVWKDDGSEFISGYRHTVDGVSRLLAVEDVIHFRAGIPDPDNSRKSLSPLAAVLREICTDNEAATFSASLLRNMGMPGVVISPMKEEVGFSAAQHEKLVSLWSSKFRGDRRGEPLVAPLPLQVSSPGFSPEQMVLDKVRRVPEERITAALGISAIVVGLGAGLERSTYSNYREAREAAYESNIIPTQRMLASQLTRSLLSELGDVDRERLYFDLSEVLGLREDQDSLHARVVADYQGGLITRAEARNMLGWPAGVGDEVFVHQV
jgi:HK97 family phage portal protein